MPESHNKDALSNLLGSGFFSATSLEEQIRKQREEREKFTNELKKAYEQGENISEYVWPPEWDFRKRPDSHHASNVISLSDAIDLCGKSFHSDAWAAKDWYARSPEQLDRWNPEHNFYRAWSFFENKKGADFTHRPQEERQAFIRKQEIYSKLSSWLNQTKIEAFTLDNEGNKGSISANIWLSHDALNILDSGEVYEKENGKPKIGGQRDFVYLNREQLEKILSKEKPPTETKIREERKPEGITCPEGIWSIEAIFLFSDKKEGTAASNRKMGDVSQSFLHFLITTPDLEVFTINSFDGEKHPIDRDYLRSKRAISDFIRGIMPYGGFDADEHDGKYIFINRDQFENFLADKPLAESSISNDNPAKSDSYMPAYLELMLNAAKTLNLSPDKRASMDDLTSWLNHNCPSDLEGKSERMIKSMATFLRRPQDKKGGNTAWK